MRGSAFIAFFGIATAISGALVGCGDDTQEAAPAAAKPRLGAEGDSCTRTDDCGADLACISNTCLPSGTDTGGTGGTSSTGGSGGKGGTTGSLGTPGESCSKRADCAPGLGCFNQRCAAADTGEGGGGPTITQGERGETCVLSSDCLTPLVCLPPARGTAGGVGVCADRDSDVQPTGNVCGAECLTAADCCELPVELHGAFGTTTPVKSCVELSKLIDDAGTDCTATGLTGAASARCFAQAAYCVCARNTWQCTAGACIYNAACTQDGLIMGGCATFSRTGRPLIQTCDTVDSDRCRLPAGMTVCDVDDDCSGKFVADDGTDTCVDGECGCYQNACYRKCTEDIDCRAGYSCDMGDNLCVPEGACTTDITCQRGLSDIRATCADGACTIPCEVDLDCNPNGLVSGGFGQVCNADHMCEQIGCTQDADCPATPVNETRVFCTTPAAATAARGVQSAITD